MRIGAAASGVQESRPRNVCICAYRTSSIVTQLYAGNSIVTRSTLNVLLSLSLSPRLLETHLKVKANKSGRATTFAGYYRTSSRRRGSRLRERDGRARTIKSFNLLETQESAGALSKTKREINLRLKLRSRAGNCDPLAGPEVKFFRCRRRGGRNEMFYSAQEPGGVMR